ncbi:AMP-binding protein [Alcanivorax sp. P2S70]|uniref:Long-chain-fatty-acid--CoA ligase n=1 Tax=Alcanivorax profundi TaxID=2338368 RepID=A0A418XWV8_9GAMM|nr:MULTISPECIES: AMP-binding protein [Alcanivorax]ERP85466.1 AMP-binding protein [Alcanivorax sp. P2S70]RJG17307.1 AMP-binding protein [Alcanivorax profundi]
MNQENRPWLSTYESLGKDWYTLPELPEKTLSDYVRGYASQFPDREALVFLGQAITYKQLDELADRMAALFAAQGAGEGDVLGMQLPNTPQYVIGFIAAARLGMVTTSISPLMTPPEITHQANDAKVKILMTLVPFWQTSVQPVLGKVPTLSTVIVSGPMDIMTGQGEAINATVEGVQGISLHDHLPATAEPVDTRVDMDKVLYLQYTGGTTGLPKGAKLTSRNLFMNNLQANEFYGYRTGEETVASAFPLFHIGGAAVVFNALRTAATFLLIPDPRDIDHFVSEMKARTPTVLAAVPALYQMLCANETFKSLDFSGLRMAISGAAPFAKEEVQKLESVVGAGKFCEVYGMTETSPVITLNPASHFKEAHVGIPLPGTDVRIVDAEDGTTLMPLGEAGEIIASGPQVMQGYLEMPEATKKSLREMDGKLWMHTGDVGVMDEDGFVRVCDRSKDMLIVGGYKVFSVEVEGKVQSLPWVAMCAVVGRADTKRPGNDVVQLYVERTPDCQQSEEALKVELEGFCRENMSPYKVPKEVFFIDAIPLTSVGKIDKKSLRQPA